MPDTAFTVRRFEAPPRWLLLTLAALLAARLGALAIARTDLFFDEAQYWFWSRELAFGYYSKPPLIAWLIRGATELCGEGEACIRAASPVVHTGTALAVYAIAQALAGRAVGAWSALAFATLPGVSFSAGLISTDVPLLFCWALALLAFIRLVAGGGWGWAVLLGVALGGGLLAKYAAAYFLLGIIVWAVWERRLPPPGKLALALTIAALCVAPNLAWNAANGFATLQHTADNARLDGPLLNPLRGLEFAAGQFAIMGALLPLLAIAAWRGRGDAATRLLCAFALPVLALMLAQATLSRAHANWGAVAYVAATVLAVGWAWHAGRQLLLRGLVLAHVALVPLLALGGALAGRLPWPGADPYARVLGWRAAAEAAATAAAGAGVTTIATDRRSLAAELSYYLRDSGFDVRAWRAEGRPRDHFELVRPLDPAMRAPVLFISLDADLGRVADSYAVQPLGERRIATGGNATRRIVLFLLRPRPVAAQ